MLLNGTEFLSWGLGFEPFQLVPTCGASFVEAVDVTHGGDPVIVFANFLNPRAEAQQGALRHNATVDVYAFGGAIFNDVIGGQAGEFFRVQSLPAMGPAGLESFAIPGYGEFLAVAARQADVPFTDSAAYDQDSALYVWRADPAAPGGGAFALHQLLGPDLASAMAPFDIRHRRAWPRAPADENATQAELEARYVAAAQQRFCGAANCSQAGDGTLTVPGLRGATALRFFAHRGEYYLAVAQSVCERGWGRAQCVQHAQPKSAVLQWNRATEVFGELLATEDVDSVVRRGTPAPPDERLVHAFALRLDAGRASDWEFVEVGGQPFLLVASGTRGMLMYRWAFERVEGLKGAVSVASDFNDTAVFAVSDVDRALVLLDRGELRDGLGRLLCAGDAPCLNFRAATEDGRTPSERVPPAKPVVEGLAGARKLTVRCPIPPQQYVNDTVCALENVTYVELGEAVNQTERVVCREVPRALAPPPREARDLFWLEGLNAACDVAVFGGPLRDETLCHAGESPPAHDARGPPVCQAVSFTVSVLSSSNDELFREAPAIRWDGTLSFEAAPLQVGEARLRVDVRDSGGIIANDGRTWGVDTGTPRFLTLRVLPVNLAPSFVAHDVFVNQNNGWERVLFAGDVTPGGPHETAQNLFWEVMHDAPPGFFAEGPLLSVLILEGRMYGVARFRLAAESEGAVMFNVTLLDDGAVDPVDEETGQLIGEPVGHASRSEQQTFVLTVRGTNQPPSFLVVPEVVHVTEGEGPYTVGGFASNITTGSLLEDASQNVTFSSRTPRRSTPSGTPRDS